MNRAFGILIFLAIISPGLFAQDDFDSDYFHELVRRRLAAISVTEYSDHFDEEYLEINQDGRYFGKGERIGLYNLRGTCALQEKSEWPEIIKSHFQGIISRRIEEQEIQPKLEQFETAVPYIKIRVYPKEFLNQIGEESIVDRRFADFIGIVVIDMPSSVKNLDSRYLEK